MDNGRLLEITKKRLEREREKVRILEQMVETKTRELYLDKQEMQRSRDDLLKILDALSGAVMVTNSALEITMCNNAAQKLFGLVGTQWNRSLLTSVLPKEWIKWIEDDLFMKTLHGAYREELYVNKSGQHVPLGVSVSVVSEDGLRDGGIVCVFVDISQRKELERELFQAQKLESVGRLSAGIAHELNTPIQYVRDNTAFMKDVFSQMLSYVNQAASVFGKYKDTIGNDTEFLELLRSLSELDLPYLSEEVPSAIAQTLAGAESVARIVRSLKDFSHPGGSQKVVADINESLKSTSTVCRNEWKYLADLVWQLDDKLPKILCYPGELNQVFLNLIINAAHAIEESLDLVRGDKGKITIGTSFTDTSVVISISDTGTGIPEAIRSKIYDPFFTTKAVGKGTGQGLALAYQCVVERHNGEIGFETEEGRGTTFRIKLPIEARA